MLMADTLAIFFSILGLMLALPGLWLTCRGLWPGMIESAATTCSRGLIRPFIAGLPLTLIVSLLIVMLNNLSGPGSIAAIGVACFYLLYANAGIAGLVTAVGRRLPSPDDLSRPWKAMLRGGVALELSFLLPVLGWFVILPAALVIGCGSASIALFKTSAIIHAPEERFSDRATADVTAPEITRFIGTPR